MYCSNCGQELAPEAKFCSNCGAPANAGVSAAGQSESDRERERREDFQKAWGAPAEPVSTTPEQPEAPSANDQYNDSSYEGGFADRKPDWELEREKLRDQTEDEWSMPSLGPPPKPRPRRKWLFILIGMIVFAVVACCVFGWWITATESGTNWFEGIATQAAEEMVKATEAAATPQP